MYVDIETFLSIALICARSPVDCTSFEAVPFLVVQCFEGDCWLNLGTQLKKVELVEVVVHRHQGESLWFSIDSDVLLYTV